MKHRVSAYVAAFGLAGLLITQCAAIALAEDKVVATINGKSILESDLALAEEEIGSDLGTLPEAQKRMTLVEFLIDNQLFADAAAEKNIDKGPAFEARLNYLKRRSLRELYFKEVIKNSVADSDAKALYDAQVAQIKPEEEVQARHILVETEDQAKDLKKKITEGADFIATAKEHSKDPGSKEDGGMLGYFGRGQMVPEFEKAVFTLNKGDVSDPIKTQFGWHLIKLEDKRKRQPPAFEVVKDRILQSLLLQKAQQTAVSLRSSAKIDIVDADLKKAIDERNQAMPQVPAPAAPATPEAKPDAAKPADAPPAEEKK